MDDKNPESRTIQRTALRRGPSSSAQESILKAHWSAAGTTLIRKISDRFALVSEVTYDNSY